MLRWLFMVKVSHPMAGVQVLLLVSLRALWHPPFPPHCSSGQEPRLNTRLAKETAGVSSICCLSRAGMLVWEPSAGSHCLPLCPSYTDIFILSSRAFRNEKQRFRLSWIQAWEHGGMTSINIQKIMASFNFQQKAYLSLKRLHQVFPCRAEQWSRCKTITGNFLYTKGDCKFLA